MHLGSAFIKARAVYAGYPNKCRVCIGTTSSICLGRPFPMCSVRCRPGVHCESIHMASPVVWIRPLSGASLDLFHSGSDLLSLLLARENLCMGAHPAHLQTCASLATRAYTWCVCVCACVCVCVCRVGGGGGGEREEERCIMYHYMSNVAGCPAEVCECEETYTTV